MARFRFAIAAVSEDKLAYSSFTVCGKASNLATRALVDSAPNLPTCSPESEEAFLKMSNRESARKHLDTDAKRLSCFAREAGNLAGRGC